MKIILLLLSAITILFELKAQPMDIKIKVRRLTDNVALLNGEIWDTNVLVVSSKKGLVMIDAPFSKQVVSCYKKAAAEEFNRDDFVYLINTHFHICHVGGNIAFDGATSIGHVLVKDAIVKSKLDESHELSLNSRLALCNQQVEYVGQLLVDGSEVPEWIVSNKQHFQDLHAEYSKGLEIATPDITFQRQLNLDLDDVTLNLRYYGYAHTSSDILVHIPEEKILLTAGAFYKDQIPTNVIDQNTPNDLVDNWISTLDYYLDDAVDLKYIVTSHGGEESIYDKGYLLVCRNYLKKLWDKAQSFKKEGKSIDIAKTELDLERKFPELKGFKNSVYEGSQWEISDIHKNNIERFWSLAKQ